MDAKDNSDPIDHFAVNSYMLEHGWAWLVDSNHPANGLWHKNGEVPVAQATAAAFWRQNNPDHTPTPLQPENHIAPAHKMVQPDTTLHHCDFECSGRHGDTTDSELREIYERCDVSNNRTDNPMGFDEFVAALKARDTRREAEAKSLAQQQGFLAGFRWGFNSVDEDVATEECRKWQATLKERTKDE